MLNKTILSTTLFSCLFVCSCVSSKKYKAANSEIEQLKVSNSQQASQNADLQNQLNTVSSENKNMKSEFASYKSDCQNAQRQLNSYKMAMEEERGKLEKMRDIIQVALADFKDKGVDVYSKDGRVYVNMEDNLLYKSGSAKLGEEGKHALRNLSEALAEYPNLKIVVVGHTDDVKFKNANSDNLSLSTERANGVVRILRDEFKIDPIRLTAAGQGKYHPIGDNQTAEGRSKNRRTEIILNPDLNKIYDSVQN